jgi:hypothetical protein
MDALTRPTAKVHIEALRRGARAGWPTPFEPVAKLCGDPSPRDLETFTADALGRERFTSIERASAAGLEVVDAFHANKSSDLVVFLVPAAVAIAARRKLRGP